SPLRILAGAAGGSAGVLGGWAMAESPGPTREPASRVGRFVRRALPASAHVRDGLGDQPLTGLARVHVTEGLGRPIDLEQPGVAGLAGDERVGDDPLEGREHVRDVRTKGLRRGGNRLVEQLRDSGADRIRIVERVVVDDDDLATVAGATKVSEYGRHVGLDA